LDFPDTQSDGADAEKQLSMYKHCLVKWAGLDFDRATWELTA